MHISKLIFVKPYFYVRNSLLFYKYERVSLYKGYLLNFTCNVVCFVLLNLISLVVQRLAGCDSISVYESCLNDTCKLWCNIVILGLRIFFFLGPKAPCTSQEFIIKIFYLYPFRSVGKTQMNEQSSRSHFVFTLRIFGINEVQSFSTVQFSFFCFLDVVLLKLIFLNFHSCVLEH